MRCSYDGLGALVRRQLGQNPLSGHGFIFINRRRTQLKCLYFQAGGYCVWSKRLERGRFATLSPTAGQAITLSHAEFEALIEGLEPGIRTFAQKVIIDVPHATERPSQLVCLLGGWGEAIAVCAQDGSHTSNTACYI